MRAYIHHGREEWHPERASDTKSQGQEAVNRFERATLSLPCLFNEIPNNEYFVRLLGARLSSTL